MDPNANLAEQVRLAAEIRHLNDAADQAGEVVEPWAIDARATPLAQLVIALNDWLSQGGVLPAAWQQHRP